MKNKIAVISFVLILTLLIVGYGNQRANTSNLRSVTGTWSYTGNLNSPRVGYTATRLQNGSVLVTGGSGLSSAEIYNPSTATWSYAANMQEARSGHSATLLANGQVLVVGGQNGGIYSTTAELYNPNTNNWSYTDGPIRERTSHQATRLADGRVLITGGWQPSGGGFTFRHEVDIYDPVHDSWTYAGHNLARVGHTTTLLDNGQVLIAGGFYNEPIDEARLYDPTTNSLEHTGSLNTKRIGHSATRLPNGTVLVAGGRAETTVGSPTLASAEIYNPATGTWSYTNNMNIPKSGHSTIRLPNGLILVAGGYDFTNGAAKISDAELYNPATATWSVTSSLNEPRAGQTVLLPNGRVLFAGGGDPSSTNTSAEIYGLTAVLNINHPSGAPGSYFTLTGSNFPPDSTATIRINNQTLGTIETNMEGNFSFQLTTTSADEGAYFITTAANPSATVGFILRDDLPLRPQEGEGAVFDVPAGIALTEFVYLPVVIR